MIPILGATERSTDAKSQLIQTKGPIHVDIKRGFTSSNYEWEWDGSGFSIIIRVKDVLTSDSHVTIEQNNFGLELTNLYVDPVEEKRFGRCDFSVDGTGKILSITEDITLPMITPLVCAMEAQNPQDLPWVYGQVIVSYRDYTYELVETKSIMVETVIA